MVKSHRKSGYKIIWFIAQGEGIIPKILLPQSLSACTFFFWFQNFKKRRPAASSLIEPTVSDEQKERLCIKTAM